MGIKVGFVSLGCNKNLCDTENMMGILVDNGFEITPLPEMAEVCIINTCAFIDSAKEESINTILEMAQLKNGNCRLLVVAGCLAQRYCDDIRKELPEVDVILGTTAIEDIAKAINRGLEGKCENYIKDKNLEVSEGLARIQSTPSYTAYIKIAEGCDNFCTYCAIPSIRGRYRSRPMENLIAEAAALAQNGVKELIVVAQDTTRYGIDLYGEKKLSELLKAFCAIDGIKWVRVHYCYPEEIDDKLIDTIANEKKIVKYMDMPVQHGCDSVLKRMGRKTSRMQITEKVDMLRSKIPDITIRTSIITGFPGETEEEFAELCEFLKEIQFDRLGAFAYSCEEGTPAAKMKNQLPEELREERREIVMEIAREISLQRNKNMIGKTVTVIAEGFDENLYYGRSEGESTEVDPKIYFGAHCDLDAGDFVDIIVKNADEYELFGEQI